MADCGFVGANRRHKKSNRDNCQHRAHKAVSDQSRRACKNDHQIHQAIFILALRKKSRKE
jgi:hypothetical protein